MVTKHYAGIRRDKRTAMLYGPCDTKEEADSIVARAHKEATSIDPWSHFDLPVTVALTKASGTHPTGVFTRARLHPKLA